MRIGAPVAAALALACVLAAALQGGAPVAEATARHDHGAAHGSLSHVASAMEHARASLADQTIPMGAHAGCPDGGCEKFQCCFGVFTALSSPLSETRIVLAASAPVRALLLPSLSHDPADQPPKRL